MVQGYKEKGTSTAKLLSWAMLPTSTYYYRHKEGRPGVKPSTHTLTADGERKANLLVVEAIEIVLRQEFCCYGYRMMTAELNERGFLINHKKVYRMMKENHLLFGGRICVHGERRRFVRFRKITAERPLQYLCMDIKYVHLYGEGRNALLLTILDVYTRKVLMHMLRYHVKKGDVLVLLSLLLLEYRPEGMTLRCDNGSQFTRGAVRQYLKQKGVYQEFSRVATPEDNSYIEALHSNLQREVIDRFELESLQDAQQVISRYYKWYNEKRRHWALQKQTPQKVWNDFFYPSPMKTTNLSYAPEIKRDQLNREVKTLQKLRGRYTTSG